MLSYMNNSIRTCRKQYCHPVSHFNLHLLCPIRASTRITHQVESPGPLMNFKNVHSRAYHAGRKDAQARGLSPDAQKDCMQ